MSDLSPFARGAYKIYSPRLTIRTAIESDAEDICDFITNADNNPHTQTESNVTMKFVIALRSTGEHIGYGGFNCFNIIEENATPRYLADFGITIAQSHW
ncbi:hypothetical protein F4782DRAFT_529206 [Xylaria castorea]|nr:hypothetical protein F4782DRAFT_529206 [Xylaria castorea]